MAQPTPDSEPVCYDSLWEAIESVEGAVLWKTYLRNSGLDIVSRDPSYAGSVFVVKDEGLVGCDVSAVLFASDTWPQTDCGQQVREKTFLLSEQDGQSLLLFNWIPGLNSSMVEYGVGYRTLLASASAGPGLSAPIAGLSIQFLGDRTVALLDGALPKEGIVNAVQSTTIVEEKALCDPSKGHVYVVDGLLFSQSSPVVSPTSLPPLEGFCETSIYNILKKDDRIDFALELAIGAYVAPVLLPITDPATNITLFAPLFQGDLNLLDSGYLPVGAQGIQNQVALYLLMGALPGGYCPEDFGPDGLLVNSLGGEFAGKNLTMLVRQSLEDPWGVEMDLQFGNSQANRYTAKYLGTACYSTVYEITNLISPYSDTTDPSFVDGVPFESLNMLPHVSQDLLFNVADECSGRLGPISGPNGEAMQGVAPPSAGSSSSTLSSGAIAGVVIGGLAGFGLLILMYMWARRRRQHRLVQGTDKGSTRALPSSPSTGSMALTGARSSSETSDGKARSTINFTEEDLILKESEVTIDEDPVSGEPVVLGKGRFGKVYRGTLLASEPVAIKCIEEEKFIDQPSDVEASSDRLVSEGLRESHETGRRSFAHMSHKQVLEEIGLLKSCRSQYIVSFIGAMLQPHEVRLVTELMPCGDLWNALGHGSSPRTVTWYDSGIFIAMDVAAGLNYLHQKKRVIHFDIKSSNILLRESKREPPSPRPVSRSGALAVCQSRYTGSYQAKVSDVGLSKFLPASHDYLTSMRAGGTWGWCAPEVILNAKCTSSADMYSYGVVLWEICTGEVPVRGRMRDVRVPDECPQRIADLIHRCLWWEPAPGWNADSNPSSSRDKKRPSAGDCIQILLFELNGQ